MANKSLSLSKVNFYDVTAWTKGRERENDSENVVLQAKCHDDNVNGRTCNLHIIRMEHANAKSFVFFLQANQGNGLPKQYSLSSICERTIHVASD